MLKGKQKKLDVNKDGKISGDDFAMLKNVRMQKKDAMGKKVVKAESGKMIAKDDTTEYVKRRKKLGGAGTIFKAESGKMVTDSAIQGAEAAGDIEGSIKPFLKEKPITPKERREKDIAKRAQKKMGGGMMMQDSMGYKRGGSVLVKTKLGRTKPTKMF
jgi:hypothetical protein